jgi:hypothetical protein
LSESAGVYSRPNGAKNDLMVMGMIFAHIDSLFQRVQCANQLLKERLTTARASYFAAFILLIFAGSIVCIL